MLLGRGARSTGQALGLSGCCWKQNCLQKGLGVGTGKLSFSSLCKFGSHKVQTVKKKKKKALAYSFKF